MVTHQLQVERRTGKVRRPETDVLPLSHATNYVCMYVCYFNRVFATVLSSIREPVEKLAHARKLVVGLPAVIVGTSALIDHDGYGTARQ